MRLDLIHEHIKEPQIPLCRAIIAALAKSLDYGDEAIDEMLNRAHPTLMDLAD